MPGGVAFEDRSRFRLQVVLKSPTAELLLEQRADVVLSDLILPSSVHILATQFIEEQQRADLLRSYNLEPRSRVLLTGPPGNGKTSLAEAIATALSVPFLVVRYEKVVNSYLGETAKRLQEVFQYARLRQCVLFFDEFDALAKEREDRQESGEIKRVLNSLLLEVDRLPSYVILIAATNHPDLLDRAVWRRFQIRTNLPLPDREHIARWFELLASRFPQLNVRKTKRSFSRLEGASYSELQDLAQNVLRRCVLDGDTDPDRVFQEQMKLWILNHPKRVQNKMATLPILIFPTHVTAARAKKGGGETAVHLPNARRQGSRIGPQIQRLNREFAERTAALRTDVGGAEPEKVIVLETAGSISDFFNAVRRIGGMEWLAEVDEEVAADQDFYRPDKRDAPVGGRLFLVMANRAALDELLRLWAAYQPILSAVRTGDSINGATSFAGCGLSAYGTPRIVYVTLAFSRTGDSILRTESSRYLSKRSFGFVEMRRRGGALLLQWSKLFSRWEARSSILRRTMKLATTGFWDRSRLVLLHGFLRTKRFAWCSWMKSCSFVRLGSQFQRPRTHLRLRSRAMSEREPAPTGAPRVGLLDGLPLRITLLLTGRLVVDDPQAWEQDYQAAERVHGTAMASLIAWGDLSSGEHAITRPLYVVQSCDPIHGISAYPKRSDSGRSTHRGFTAWSCKASL